MPVARLTATPGSREPLVDLTMDETDAQAIIFRRQHSWLQ